MFRTLRCASHCCSARASGAGRSDPRRLPHRAQRPGWPPAASRWSKASSSSSRSATTRSRGRKVELIIADTGGNPAGARTKTQELVEREKVHVLGRSTRAFEALAIDDYIRQTRTPTVSCSAAAEDLTAAQANPWFVRSAASSGQPNHAVGEYAAKTLGYKRVAIIADDFAYGHETAAAFPARVRG